MSGVDIEAYQNAFEGQIEAVDSLRALEELKAKYLGRKGILAQLTGSIPQLPQGERAGFGQRANIFKNRINVLIAEKQRALTPQRSPHDAPASSGVDIGLPGYVQEPGHLHPITQTIDEICLIFSRMGFSIVEGPEIETEYNNFTGLNIPLDHPSRDAFDTFYLKGTQHLLLRSHTSPVQIRAMKSTKPPLAVVVPGRVYRPDATDASHLFMFHQVEGFLVDQGIKFSDLKGILEVFLKNVFGREIKTRFRPHFFPFTEPSAEVDISCSICKGAGCSSCGQKGWLEILGSGMIHPNVLKNVGYDNKKYSGFAFGMGIERIAMLKYGINDIRLFCENDLRFLKQF
jgi:phenylalanyl-tRNA synthetase alpha chain